MTTPKTLTVWITANYWKFFKRWEYQTTSPSSWEVCMQVNMQQLEPNVEQQTGFKFGKESVKAVYCHPVYLDYIQTTSCKMPGWMKHKLESRLLGEISITSDVQMIPLLWQKGRGTKEPLDESEGESEKVGLKLNIQRTKIIIYGPITSRKIDGETVTDFIFLGSKITAHGDGSHEIKIWLLFGRKAITNLDSIWKSRDISLPTRNLVI